MAPVVGPLLTKSSCARFARTMGIMFGSGVPMVVALTSVATASPNSVFRLSCYQIQDDVSTGRPLSTAMEDTKLFPNLVLAMVSIGEESGELEKMLNKTADGEPRQPGDRSQLTHRRDATIRLSSSESA